MEGCLVKRLKKSDMAKIFTVPEALTLRALTLRFYRNFRKLTAKNSEISLNVTIFSRLPSGTVLHYLYYIFR